MNTIYKKITIAFSIFLFSSIISNAQCIWQTQLSDGFEYATACPDLIPGTTVHVIPQSFAVHSGSTSLYMNFINCNGGTGTCAGAKVYERRMVVCPNVNVRLTAWLTTSFSGTQCNMHIKVAEKDGTVINDQPAVSAPYYTTWYQYQSGAFTPVTDTIVFTMYTNVDGGNGNDLSMDDFKLERCIGDTSSTTNSNACNNLTTIDLFNSVPSGALNTGNWTGPASLANGYLGTFNIATGTPGVYVYHTTPYGTSATCPLVNDSVNVAVLAAPVVNLGQDTSMCLNQNLLLNAGTGSNYTYLWNNGVTGPTVLAFTTSITPIVKTYSVVVTASNGCSASDSMSINFIICTGINDVAENSGVNVYPNPSNGNITIDWNLSDSNEGELVLYNSLGKCVNTVSFSKLNNKISMPGLASGIYEYQILENKTFIKSGKLMITDSGKY